MCNSVKLFHVCLIINMRFKIVTSDCLSCKAAMLNEDCQFHKIGYNHIKDTPILSKARTSIPSCLTLQPTSTFGYNVYLGL